MNRSRDTKERKPPKHAGRQNGTPGKPLLAVQPGELRERVLPLLIPFEAISADRLARGIGSDTNVSRAITRYTNVLEIIGLTTRGPDGITLTHRGIRFRNATGVESARSALMPVWTEPGIPADVYKAVSQSGSCTKEQFAVRLRAVEHEEEAEFWLSWLITTGIAEQKGDTITFTALPRALLYTNAEIRRHREIVYRELAALTNPTLTSGGNCYHSELPRLLAAFHGAKPDKAESHMARFVEAAFRRLGLIVQTSNGPRDTGATLHFDTEGDDAVASFLYPPSAASEEFNGFAIPIELKRTYSDKKAVAQVLAARGRIESFYGSIETAPITISGSETYSDKVARDYAKANNVLHLPIEALNAIAEEQMSRYRDGRPLLTFADLWQAIVQFRTAVYIEPTTEDWTEAVTSACDARCIEDFGGKRHGALPASRKS